jgi:hypothetical protein
LFARKNSPSGKRPLAYNARNATSTFVHAKWELNYSVYIDQQNLNLNQSLHTLIITSDSVVSACCLRMSLTNKTIERLWHNTRLFVNTLYNYALSALWYTRTFIPELIPSPLGYTWNGIKLTCQWIRKYSCRFFLGITKYALICEHGLVTIRCPFGLIINITTAFWGVLQRHHCSSRQSFKGCGLKEIPTTTSSLKNYCDHIRACDLSASPFMPYFLKLTDPCPRINKYLEVNYSCVMRKYQTYIWTLFNSVV